MKVEIWSDVMCPFCYIGKRRFENALAQFENKDEVEIVWRSFQLNPTLQTDPSKNTIEHLAESKGWDMDYTRKTTDYVVNMAKELGLNYDFEKAIVANSFKAHRLLHLAKQNQVQNECEEKLFEAYFIHGKNIDDNDALLELGLSLGIDLDSILDMLSSDAFASDVESDIYQAQQIGVQGVPFFVFDNKYAISGAQQSETFLAALYKAKQS
ncbi:MAG: DsbA family oxidoreductase [Bacteroidetes bacterium]|nr:DsbA family oxidoreductase [Bacteroidota bacterium]